MGRNNNYEPENYKCSWCKYFSNGCKRVDGKKINFAKSPFSCEPCCPYVCCDFELQDYRIYAKQNWIDFETYWKEYLECWLPKRKLETMNVYFTLNGDDDVRYGVRILDYIYGNMYTEDGRLNVVEKMYYRQTRNGFGYKLIRENIDNGINIISKSNGVNQSISEKNYTITKR